MKACTRVFLCALVPSEATIGPGTMLGYGGLGSVIHQRSVIGANVMVGSHVTIGGRSRLHEVPVIEDDVFIGAGACILGPVHVGRGAVIGANAVVIEDVPPRTVVAGVPARIIRENVDSRDYGDLPDDIRSRKRG
jgi:serine O-acetyltransferase